LDVAQPRMGRMIATGRWPGRILALALTGAILAGCAVHHESRPVYQPAPQAVHIPPGHMPPPGKCRIWFPDRPPGHQGPVGKCGKLQYRVPPGAILVRG
jgi:hypothetical protein